LGTFVRAPGFCLWFTGLSGAGKTTTAELVVQLLERRSRVVTMLDGDVVRTHLSKGLGFSREDRDENVRRVGFVAAEIVRHGGAVVCALVSPYRSTRDEVRALVGDGFVEVYVDTPLEVVQARDVKGLYAGAERGEVTKMTGVSDPYEPPLRPELRLQTVDRTAAQNAAQVIAYLEGRGLLESA
jgi:sulfate adenylyltransferase